MRAALGIRIQLIDKAVAVRRQRNGLQLFVGGEFDLLLIRGDHCLAERRQRVCIGDDAFGDGAVQPAHPRSEVDVGGNAVRIHVLPDIGSCRGVLRRAARRHHVAVRVVLVAVAVRCLKDIGNRVTQAGRIFCHCFDRIAEFIADEIYPALLRIERKERPAAAARIVPGIGNAVAEAEILRNEVGAITVLPAAVLSSCHDGGERIANINAFFRITVVCIHKRLVERLLRHTGGRGGRCRRRADKARSERVGVHFGHVRPALIELDVLFIDDRRCAVVRTDIAVRKVLVRHIGARAFIDDAEHIPDGRTKFLVAARLVLICKFGGDDICLIVHTVITEPSDTAVPHLDPVLNKL